MDGGEARSKSGSEAVASIIGLVVGNEWIQQCDRLPKVEKRTSMTISLIKSYGLFSKLKLLQCRSATRSELESFHSCDYLDHCAKASKNTDLEKLENDQEEKENTFGMGYDCPLLDDLYDLMSWVAGGSVTAAEFLTKGTVKRAINWGGGWHHAQRDEASGFCYVNDIVLAIHQLRTVFDRVLYVDLDAHHGDGVENAFAFTPKVFTFSLHKFESGYFPGSGSLQDVGFGNGKNYCLNIPLKEGIDDKSYASIFDSLFDEIIYAFRPDAIVVQCGSDALALDPLGGLNLTPQGMGHCVSRVLNVDVPTLVLGGGGYNLANASRCWTYLTGLILGQELPNDIPDCDPFFSKYGPSFELAVKQGARPNMNHKQTIDDMLEEAFEHLEDVS